MGDRMGSSPIDRTKKMTCTFIVQVFFCKGVRNLNGTLRKQHGALFLVPGVSTALAAQKIVFFYFQFLFFKKLEVFLKIC